MIDIDYFVEPLRRNHQRESFDCGEASLNEFLFFYARQNDERGLGKTFVAIHDSQPLEIAGYYTLSSGSVSFENIPEKLPRYPVPVVHLGRLATDLRVQGKGVGKLLFYDALRRSLIVAEQIGVFAVEVYALNETASDFYLKYGFQKLLDDPFHLYLSIKSVRKLFANF